MAITPLAPLDRTSPTFRTDVDNFFGSAIPAFVGQANALAANLNSIAAGGAYAIPMVASANSATIAQGGYFTIQSNGGTLYFDATDSAGANISARLVSIFTGSSAVKATLRAVEIGDPSRYTVWDITSYANSGTYVYAVAQIVDDKFVRDGKPVMLFFQRTGDKGDASTLTPVLWVRDEKASGVAGGLGIQDGYVVRTLNTAKKNSMSGASLAGNQITLPAGTFRVSFTAPAGPTASNHKAYLYNVTDGVTTVAGTSTYAPQSTQIVTVSQVLCAEFTISSSKVFEVRHWIAATGTPNLGAASSSGQVEVYTDVFIEKVS